MKIYTKTGDDGETGLFAGPRVRKDDVRIEAYGAVDELNAFLGAARCEALPAEVAAVVAAAQHALFAVGAELATPEPEKHGMTLRAEAQVTSVEQAIDALEANLPPLTQFVLPAGTPAAAALHVARSVCRRAERRVISLTASAEVSLRIVRYLNRLGDYLFVAARAANHAAGEADVPWRKS